MVAYFDGHAPSMHDSRCWVYLDNDNCIVALVLGDSDTEVIAILVALPAACPTPQRLRVVSPRAPNLNPAYLLDRAKILPYRAAFPPFPRSIGALYRSRRPQLRLMYLENPPTARRRKAPPPRTHPLALEKKIYPHARRRMICLDV